MLDTECPLPGSAVRVIVDLSAETIYKTICEILIKGAVSECIYMQKSMNMPPLRGLLKDSSNEG
jgi:hypothetical protein